MPRVLAAKVIGMNLSHDRTQWIVIANGSRARILERRADAQAVLIRSFHHAPSRQHSSELGDDHAGNQATGRGFGSAALGPRTDPHEREIERFASDLAEHLEAAARTHAMDAVMVFASSHFLGLLRQRLGSSTRKMIEATINVDISGLPLPEVDRRVAEVMARVRSMPGSAH